MHRWKDFKIQGFKSQYEVVFWLEGRPLSLPQTLCMERACTHKSHIEFFHPIGHKGLHTWGVNGLCPSFCKDAHSSCQTNHLVFVLRWTRALDSKNRLESSHNKRRSFGSPRASWRSAGLQVKGGVKEGVKGVERLHQVFSACLPKSKYSIKAFCTCMRFSASSQTTD